MAKTNSGTHTLEKGLIVLEYIAENKTTNLTQLSKSLGMNISTLYRYLTTYKKRGYLSQDDNDAYFLTDKLMKMASGIVPQMEMRNIALPYLDQLAEITPHNGSIGFWNGKDILYLAQKRPQLISIFVVGETIPAYCSALGKSILAYLPEEELDEYIRKTPLVSFTKKTTSSKEKLYKELAQIRKNGYSVMDGELVLGLFGVAVPIFAGEKIPKYAISLSSSLNEDIQNNIDKMIIHLKSISEQISDKVISLNNLRK